MNAKFRLAAIKRQNKARSTRDFKTRIANIIHGRNPDSEFPPVRHAPRDCVRTKRDRGYYPPKRSVK